MDLQYPHGHSEKLLKKVVHFLKVFKLKQESSNLQFYSKLSGIHEDKARS